MKAPTNSDGANEPPTPPAPLVADIATTLKKQRGDQVQHDDPADAPVLEKHRVVEQRIDVSVHQIGQRFVPFAVKRREQEDQDADDQAARDPTAVHAFDPGEQLPDFRVDLCEIVRHQSAYQAQDDVVRQVFQFERVQDIEVENRIETVQENISVVAVTAEISSGMIDATVMSSISISNTKTTPVIGALNTADRAAAAPQLSSSVMFL